MIVYTVGHTASYDQGLREDPNLKKLGKTDDYEGGWIWKTPEEAKKFLTSDYWSTIDWGDNKSRDASKFSVYCIQFPNSWEEDVYPASYDNIYLLLHDAIILGKFEK